MEKKEFRRQAELARKKISGNARETAAGKCMEHIFSMESFRKARNIYVYISFRSEMPTKTLIERMIDDDKTVAVPKIEGGEMHFYPIRSLSDCRLGVMGILEPDGKGEPFTLPGLCLTPGLAFDKDGYRLGYGGGFYDRFFAQHPYIERTGIGFSCQIYERIPRQPHDIRLQTIVTDAGIIIPDH